MTDALEIASDDDSLCLASGPRRYSFSELAQRASETAASLSPGQPLVVVATNTLKTVVQLYACLLARTPFVALHPKLPADQQEALRQRVPKTLPPDIAAVLFTSGTSGNAKGVLLSRSALQASAHGHGCLHPWRVDDHWLCCLPLAHIGGLSIVTRSLVARKPVSLVSSFSAASFVDAINANHCTITSLVPTMLTELLDNGFDCPLHLRLVLLGGARLSPSLLDRARRARVPVVSSYGMTESCAQIYSGDKLIPGAELRVRNHDGAIQWRGPMMCRGYLPPEQAPISDEGWFTTSDYGDYRDGRLHVLGRIDDIIVTGGENVSPQLVEDRLLADPAVSQCCVFGVEDPHYGQLVAAAIQLSDSTEKQHLGSVVAKANRGLASYQRVRLYCLAKKFPVTPTGKISRQSSALLFSKELRKLA